MFNKKFSKEPTEKQKTGQMGEDLACQYLEKSGYKVIDRNYLKKWGEIDIVTKKDKKIHFVEVKTVSRDLSSDVIRETPEVEHPSSTALADYGTRSSLRGKQNDSYRPEDNLHPWKLKRLGRAIQSYLLEKDISDDIDWQFDVVIVYIDKDKGLNNVFLLEDIVL